jgi:hypothetical protein
MHLLDLIEADDGRRVVLGDAIRDIIEEDIAVSSFSSVEATSSRSGILLTVTDFGEVGALCG